MLITGPAAATGVQLLERLGYEVLGSTGTVTRLRNRQATGAELADTCRSLRTLGVSAGPNHVTAARRGGEPAACWSRRWRWPAWRCRPPSRRSRLR